VNLKPEEGFSQDGKGYVFCTSPLYKGAEAPKLLLTPDLLKELFTIFESTKNMSEDVRALARRLAAW
jgi:hypothetical protein